jgi:hypothetical protein
VRAHQPPAPQPHIDDHRLLSVDELDRTDPYANQAQQLVEYSTSWRLVAAAPEDENAGGVAPDVVLL